MGFDEAGELENVMGTIERLSDDWVEGTYRKFLFDRDEVLADERETLLFKVPADL